MKLIVFNMIVLIIIPFLINIFMYGKYKKKIKYEELIRNVAISDVIIFVISKYVLRLNNIAIDFKHTIISSFFMIVIGTIIALFFNKKLKQTYELLLKRIEKLSSLKWMCITFVILLICILAVSPRIIVEPYLMVEDGSVFLSQQFDRGLASIFDPYGGYCILISRLSAFISAHIGAATNSIVVTINVLKWITILFSIICINYLNKDDFEWITKNRIIRLLLSLIILFMLGNFQFMFYSTTSIHWFCGILSFIVGINIIKDNFPSYAFIPIIGICILSSPSALVLGISLLIYLIKKIDLKSIIKGTVNNIGTSNFIKMALLAIFLVIQMIFILFINKGESGGATNSLFDSIWHVIILTINTPLYVLGVSMSFSFDNIYTASIMGFIILLMMFSLIKNKKIFIYAVVSIFFLYFMVLYKNNDPEYYMYLFTDKYWLYNAVPATIMLLMFMICITQLIKPKNIHLLFIIYAGILVFMCDHLYFYNYDYCDGIKEIESRVDFNSTYYVKVPIFPGDCWYLNVPVEN